MNHKLPLVLGGGALAVIGVCLVLMVVLRVEDRREFQQVYHVQSYNGTNYVIQLTEATVGKVDTDCVLLVYARIQNPNASALTLRRDWFVLVDAEKNYYQPVTTGTQNSLIQVPPHGTAEKELISFVIPDAALDGHLAMEVGHNYFTLIKSDKRFDRPLSKGQFFMIHQLDW